MKMIVALALYSSSICGFQIMPAATTTRTTRGMTLPSPEQRRLPSLLRATDQQEDLAARLQAEAKRLRDEAYEIEESFERERRAKFENELDDFFLAADSNGDGYVSLEELKSALQKKFVDQSSGSERQKKRARALIESDERVEVLLKDLDMNADGVLERKEMILDVPQMRERLERLFREEQDAEASKTMESRAIDLVEKRLETYEKKAGANGLPPRLIGGLVYLLPFLDALPFTLAPQALPGSPTEAVLRTMAQALVLFRTIPFSGILAFIALNYIASNPASPRLARFSARHAILLDICTFILPLIALAKPEASFVPGTAIELAVIVSASAAFFGIKADFVPGTGTYAQKFVDNFDNSVKSFLQSASAAQVTGFFGEDKDAETDNNDSSSKKNDDNNNKKE